MVTVYAAIKQVADSVNTLYQLCRSHDIRGYQPQPLMGDQPVIQYWQPIEEAYVVGVATEPPGVTYDRQTSIIRSYTRSLHDDNVGHLERLRENHITEEFLGNLLRFTTSPIYDTPSLPNQRIHLNTEQNRSTLDDRLNET